MQSCMSSSVSIHYHMRDEATSVLSLDGRHRAKEGGTFMTYLALLKLYRLNIVERIYKMLHEPHQKDLRVFGFDHKSSFSGETHKTLKIDVLLTSPK